MKITTNNAPRPLFMAIDLPAKIIESDFDYIEDDCLTARFFRYRGLWYDAHEFVRVQLRGAAGFNQMCHTVGPGEPLASWHAIQNDSYFSGIVIRLMDDGESVIVGTAIL